MEKLSTHQFCSGCSEKIHSEALSCPKCGKPTMVTSPLDKSQVTAGLLAIFFGGLGVHKFYLGKTGMGCLYLVFFLFFFWTFIPAIIGLIEGIIYLTATPKKWAEIVKS